MLSGLIDQDLKPREPLVADLEGDVQLEVGVEATEAALIDALGGTNVLFTTSRLPVTETVLEAATDLELVAKIGTGIDSIDLDAAAEHDVTVVYTPGLNALAVAEHAVSLLLAVNRNVLRGQRTIEAGGWRDEMPLSRSLTGQTIGIVGFGNVGKRVAGLLDGFHTETLAFDPYVHEIDTQITGTTLLELEELLARADSVVVTAALTDETRGMIDADALESLDDDAVLVNTSRGAIVDQPALLEAIRDGSIGGAGLDAFETEPLPEDSPFRDHDNVVLTPHIAATTREYRHSAVETLAELTTAHIEGSDLPDRFVAVRPTERPVD
ncbi:D-3-phosphoglycerate dehydrogenase [Salinadaptatus halalkaliphilus]|uniref:D-3-phosphoglycerate dehydrogenase n=1 Tax=Salinadaptatus halalkaliphilus TaxID=2419781 RepID=A0A4S3TRL1_9EURY|nr:NAD(P)-dependent oxidoreductase [Salinadaptatus halalkaliphilus]THE65965.1 D-3-phosphoglycerate dehydrogenase [Salinadaptatus halalkaliphilus]